MRLYSCFFFFNDTATTEIYTLSLHDALPISTQLGPGRFQLVYLPDARSFRPGDRRVHRPQKRPRPPRIFVVAISAPRSEEHTSELQSRQYLVCRLLLEKKKKNTPSTQYLFIQ